MFYLFIFQLSSDALFLSFSVCLSSLLGCSFFLLLSFISSRLFYLSRFICVLLLLCINYFVILYLSFPYLSLFSPTPYLIILFVSLFLFFFIKNTLFYFYHLLLCIFLYLSFSYFVRNKRVHSGIGCRQFLQKKKNLYLFF